LAEDFSAGVFPIDVPLAVVVFTERLFIWVVFVSIFSEEVVFVGAILISWEVFEIRVRLVFVLLGIDSEDFFALISGTSLTTGAYQYNFKRESFIFIFIPSTLV